MIRLKEKRILFGVMHLKLRNKSGVTLINRGYTGN